MVNLYFITKYKNILINAETKILSGGDENQGQGIYFIWPYNYIALISITIDIVWLYIYIHYIWI